ncbi:MAG: Trk system potassium transporter TrkA [Salinivirgaceae bacterium]|jgi:trk system potassium uptake protein TrkA|nr:Trk system potassium transporter TrkA [Salinivirgaceae bacterium]
MKIIIAGAGEVGMYLAKMLATEHHEIVVMDTNKDRLEDVSTHFDLLTVEGTATSFENLKEAGVKNADLFIAVTHELEVNITSCIISKKLGAKRTIARVDNREYLLPINKAQFISLGIDSLVYPQMLAAREIVSLLSQTGTSEVFNFSGGSLSLFVLRLDESAPVMNKTLQEASKIDKELIYRAVAISRDGNTIIPRGNDVFMPNDIVYVITNQKGVSKLMKYSGQKKLDTHNIMILGGSRIGARTAIALQDTSKVKLIEHDHNKCLELADTLPNAMIINGDGRNIDLLREENIEKMDVFIAVTSDSETNILTCIQAKRLGVQKTIAAVENTDYINLAENLGIDAMINKKLITASYIMRFTVNADVPSFVCLTGSDAEVLEFVVRPGAKITKTSLKEINFPKEAIIGGVIRDKKGFIARGDTVVHSNDRVVVFALPSIIHKIEGFFN